jgi:hypothetical protein
MPKQILKIDQFHGGLSSNSDPRDIADNELSAATDVMVDELGKIRTMGGTVAHDATSNPTVVIEPGYGLFQFSHDRVGGEDAGSSEAETGDDYLALADTDGGADVHIYAKTGDGSGEWSSASRIDLGSTTGMKPTFYAVDGALRVSDGNFGAANETKWYGYIYRRFFGDGTNGYDGTGYTNGLLKDKWHTDEAAPKALPINWIYTPGTISSGNILSDSDTPLVSSDNYPIIIQVDPGTGTPDAFFTDAHSAYGSEAKISDHSILARITWAVDGVLTEHGSSVQGGYNNFCSVGDRILVTDAAVASNNNRMYTVEAVTDSTITVDLSTDTSDTDDVVVIYNVSRSGWYGGIDNEGWEFGVSTLYDDSKQESAVSKFELTGAHDAGADSPTVMTDTDTKSNGLASFGTDDLIGFLCKNLTDGSEGIIMDNDANTVTLYDLEGGSDNSWDDGDLYSISVIKPLGMVTDYATLPGITTGAAGNLSGIRLSAYVFAGDGTNDGISVAHPRVSGFKIYMRHENTETWYLQSEIDISKGLKTAGSEPYKMWEPAERGTETVYQYGEYLSDMRQVETYDSETGSSADYNSVGFDGTGTGFKTAVIANRMAYVGNVKIKDKQGNTFVHGDAVLKSSVNKFDSFTLDRKIEASVNDGDEIEKIEAYADRLLIFKNNKMELVNVSQDVEFLEDIFVHKGVSHPAATCKTDFGIAWVNKFGCYLYDGQKVNNLLEKGGRQIIKESYWATFTTREPMIGYIPKKRQLLIANDVTTTGDGATFLYDMVTQSWVEGAAATITSEAKTNFITDWNGDLVYAHTTGTMLKWDDASATSAAMDIQTKDIDFGQPGQNKKVYKVIVTYQSSNATTNVQVDYGVDGDTTFAYDFTVPELPAADGWQTAELVPDTSSEANNIKSIRLRFGRDGTVPAAFEINDISIVYRLKPVK